MINSRKVEDLVPEMQALIKKFIEGCKAVGVDVLITSTYRDFESQDALYAQGRTKPGLKVTNAKGGQSVHNFRAAADFVPLKDGNPDWNDLKKFAICGQVAKAVGLDWGGEWKSFKDLPHVQLKGFKFPK